jgi:hypothetical protein
MIFWLKKPKKNKILSEITVKLENDKIVIQTHFTRDDAISIRENLRKEYRCLPKLNKDTFENCWNGFIENGLYEILMEAVQELADEHDKPSKLEPW